jgi:hypothetical protein
LARKQQADKSSSPCPTHLVNHIGQKTFNLIRVNCLATLQANCSRKFSNRDSSPSNRRCAFLLRLLEATSDENPTQKVPKRDVAAALKREVYAALHELVFAFLQREIERPKVTFSDAPAEWEKEALQSRVGLEEFLAGEGVCCQEVAWDEIS